MKGSSYYSHPYFSAHRREGLCALCPHQHYGKNEKNLLFSQVVCVSTRHFNANCNTNLAKRLAETVLNMDVQTAN